jgi:hypothetical protein
VRVAVLLLQPDKVKSAKQVISNAIFVNFFMFGSPFLVLVKKHPLTIKNDVDVG